MKPPNLLLRSQRDYLSVSLFCVVWIDKSISRRRSGRRSNCGKHWGTPWATLDFGFVKTLTLGKLSASSDSGVPSPCFLSRLQANLPASAINRDAKATWHRASNCGLPACGWWVLRYSRPPAIARPKGHGCLHRRMPSPVRTVLVPGVPSVATTLHAERMNQSALSFSCATSVYTIWAACFCYVLDL